MAEYLHTRDELHPASAIADNSILNTHHTLIRRVTMKTNAVFVHCIFIIVILTCAGCATGGMFPSTHVTDVTLQKNNFKVLDFTDREIKISNKE